jgi:hypothetical protein
VELEVSRESAIPFMGTRQSQDQLLGSQSTDGAPSHIKDLPPKCFFMYKGAKNLGVCFCRHSPGWQQNDMTVIRSFDWPFPMPEKDDPRRGVWLAVMTQGEALFA